MPHHRLLHTVQASRLGFSLREGPTVSAVCGSACSLYRSIIEGGEPGMKLFDLSGRVAVVTGGNGGIGLGMALGMAEAGATIVVAGRDAAKNQAAVKQIQGARRQGECDPGRCAQGGLVPGAGGRHGEGARPARHPGQQCRHEHPQAARAIHAGRMAHGDGQQPDQRLPVQPCRLSRDEEGRRRQDHQYRLDDVDLRRALRHRLCREQGRHGADDASRWPRHGPRTTSR